MATAETTLLTAEAFLKLPDLGQCELVRGKVVPLNPPGWRHGRIGMRIAYIIEAHLEKHDLGRVAILDTGVLTQRDPDTVRGADVMYHSYQRLPAEQEPDDYPELAPEIIWEVFSPGNRWKDMLAKVAEYLHAGVLAVCVVDPQRQSFTTYYPDQPEEMLGMGDVWRAPEILPGFELPLAKVFGKR